MKTEDLFMKIEIINDLLNLIKKYLTESHKKILKELKNINMDEIVIYDPKLMVIMKMKLKKYRIFEKCAKYGRLENMKWLLRNEFPYNKKVFSNAEENGNLENMKWLYRKKFPYGLSTFSSAALNGNLENMK